MPGASPPATATVGGPTTLDTSATDDDGTAGALPAAAFDETSASESLSTLSLTSSDESEADESEVVGGDGEQRNVHRPLDDPLDEALIGEVLAEQSIGGDRVHVDVDESAVDRPQQMPALMPPPALDDAETPELASALVPLALDMDTTDLLPRDKMVDGVSGASRRLPRDRASMPLPRTISPVDSASDASVSPTRETTSLSPVIVKASVSPAARRASEESAPLQRPISASTEAPSTFLAFVSGYIGYELRAMASSDQSVDVAAHEIKRERVSNFLSVPREIERLMLFGYLVCLDTFLNVFTLFPFRVFVAATSWLMSRG